MNIENMRLIKALKRQPVDCTPIWMMRQAGRYLPEYREIRAKAGNFMTLCQTPELACEVTLQPIRRFDLDAAIIFSDILTIPDAMGLGLHFIEGEGPRFERPIRSSADIDRLGIPDPETDLAYVGNALRLARRELNNKIPLIGFAGSPWTLATYMVEGQSTREFERIKAMLYQEPDSLHRLLKKLSDAVTIYLQSQVAAGAQILMIFDTWGGVLTAQDYLQYSLQYMRQIVSQLPKDIPVVLFTKQGGQWLEAIADSGCHAVGLDWTTSIKQARQRVGNKVALQGNLDPMLLRYAKPDRIRAEVATILADYGKANSDNQGGHVFNLGHGILQHTPLENVEALIDAVHDLSKAYHE
jgi:uroporphyrinogen decarboxylase